MSSKIIATCFALAAFAVAVVAGVLTRNPAVVILERALGAMFVCWVVGYIVGAMGSKAINEYLNQYKKEHPVNSTGEDADTIAPLLSDTAGQENDATAKTNEQKDTMTQASGSAA